MSVAIIGISAYYHDSAAALLVDGVVVAAAQEERFSRKKHDPSFPVQAIRFILAKGGLSLSDIDYVVFYDKPLVKFERLLETYLACAPHGLRSFLAAMPIWLKEKLFLKETLRRELASFSGLTRKDLPRLMFTEHHQAHAASAFFPSPFQRAAVLCIDGVGEWATTSIWSGEGNRMEANWQIDFPHSLGLLYSAFTYYTGFKVNSGEYKLMGLAPYGKPIYVDRIYDQLIDLKADGSFRLNMAYFDFATGLKMTNGKFAALFGAPARRAEGAIGQREMDLAASIQTVIEEAVLRIGQTIKKRLAPDYLCLAGGVALNCVANGKLQREGLFKDIWIQPAAGDAGGAVGAALAVWHQYLDNPRQTDGVNDAMAGGYLGPAFSQAEILRYLDRVGAKYMLYSDDQLFPTVAGILSRENVVGWFQGAMEFGPRALGGRSILGDPRSPTMQSTMNLKIKYRESFRPFAPSVKAECAGDWFALTTVSPYMLLVSEVAEDQKRVLTAAQEGLLGLDKLNLPRSSIPAVTHVDYSARVQTVDPAVNRRYWRLLDSFAEISGCPVLINTSFNVRGEPIVCTPEDAYRCFIRTEMDFLVLENVVLAKTDQPPRQTDWSWQEQFTLD